MKKYAKTITILFLIGASISFVSHGHSQSEEKPPAVEEIPADLVTEAEDTSKVESGDSKIEETVVADAQNSSNTPPKPKLSTITFQTPYSLQDCIDLVNDITEALVEVGGDLNRVDRQSLTDVLDAVADYLQERDDLHSNLLGYDWEEIGRHQVKDSNNNTYSYIFRDLEIPEGITALSFEAERADSILQKVEVYNTKNELVGPYSKEMKLRHSLPRRYVYHLYQPTDIKRITIKAKVERPELNRTPQIVILAGKSNQQEHGKLAIYYILQAEDLLARSEAKNALETLYRAREEITRYRLQTRR